MILVLRSFTFNLVHYLNLLVFMLVLSPLLLAPRRWAMWAMRSWAKSADFWYQLITGVQIEIRGRENIIHGPCIVACKHQSLWETYSLLYLFDDPAIILKSELNWIPFFGWWSMKFRMVTVKRGGRSKAVRSLVQSARKRLKENRQILIFPEGTRRPPGAEPHYKRGVFAMYADLDVPCIPVALNSGLFWPRRKFMRYPGKLVLEVLPPIAPGMERDAFAELLQNRIETATDQLMLEAAETSTPPPFSELAAKHLAELTAKNRS